MITTVEQHLLKQQRSLSDATGTFSLLLSSITLATKMVEAKIRTGGLSQDVLGAFGAVNVQGEAQQKLDVYANEANAADWPAAYREYLAMLLRG